jgi:hypothetical protein
VSAVGGEYVCQKDIGALAVLPGAGAARPLATHVLLVAEQVLVLICAQWLSTSVEKGRQPAWNLVVSPATLWRVPISGAHAILRLGFCMRFSAVRFLIAVSFLHP